MADNPATIDIKLVAQLEKLVGKQAEPIQLVEEEWETQESNPEIVDAANKAIEAQKAGATLPAEVARPLVNSLFKSNNLDQALELQSALITIEDAPASDHFNYGLILKGLERMDEAEKSYRKALEIAPEDVAILSHLGYLLEETGRKEEAEATFRKAVAGDPKNADLRNQFAYYLWEHGCADEAQSEVRKALELDGNNSYAHATLGLLLFEKNDLDKGKRHYERAIKLNPEDEPLQQKFCYEYGRALVRNGYKSMGRNYLEAAKKYECVIVSEEDIDAELAKIVD